MSEFIQDPATGLKSLETDKYTMYANQFNDFIEGVTRQDFRANVKDPSSMTLDDFKEFLQHAVNMDGFKNDDIAEQIIIGSTVMVVNLNQGNIDQVAADLYKQYVLDNNLEIKMPHVENGQPPFFNPVASS
jgi:hypothetical protein